MHLGPMKRRVPFTVEVNVTQEASLVAAPREHGQGYRYGNVDPNLTHIDLGFKLASRGAGLCEDCSAITVSVLVDDIERVIQGVCFHDD